MPAVEALIVIDLEPGVVSSEIPDPATSVNISFGAPDETVDPLTSVPPLAVALNLPNESPCELIGKITPVVELVATNTGFTIPVVGFVKV